MGRFCSAVFVCQQTSIPDSESNLDQNCLSRCSTEIFSEASWEQVDKQDTEVQTEPCPSLMLLVGWEVRNSRSPAASGHVPLLVNYLPCISLVCHPSNTWGYERSACCIGALREAV